MSDIVVTVPREQWAAWLAEGDLAGAKAPYKRVAWPFRLRGCERPPVFEGERVYILSHWRIRGYAIASCGPAQHGGYWYVWRHPWARAVTIDETIRGFTGWRRVWWQRAAETPFPEWQTAGVGEDIPRYRDITEPLGAQE